MIYSNYLSNLGVLLVFSVRKQRLELFNNAFNGKGLHKNAPVLFPASAVGFLAILNCLKPRHCHGWRQEQVCLQGGEIEN